MMRHVFITILVLLLTACTANGRDPLEPMNRATYRFNDSLDQALFKPLAELYAERTPELVNRGITNFFANLYEVVVIPNQLLQLKPRDALSSTGRLVHNTIFGLGGLFDVATPMGYPPLLEDFGQTLGYWGVPPGPYLVLPIVGPSSFRDGFGRLADGQLDPVYWIREPVPLLATLSLYGLDFRADILGTSEMLDELALDPYLFTRDAWFQRRRNMVYDGAPPDVGFDPFGDPAGELP